MGLPEKIRTKTRQQLVVVVLLICHAEGRVTTFQNEEDHTECEQIHNLTLIGLLGKDLWCHVARGAHTGQVVTGSISALKRTSESKIDDFDAEIFSKKHVFGLHVSVREALRVNIVDTGEHLVEVVLAD